MEDTAPSGLEHCWSFGLNASLASGVHDLGTSRPHSILYVSGASALIYDYVNGEQTILTAHTSSVIAPAISGDKKVCATVDAKAYNDSIIVVWNVASAIPLQAIPSCRGATAIALSSDGLFVAVLTADVHQSLLIFEWTNDDTCQQPLVEARVCDREISLQSNIDMEENIEINIEPHSHLRFSSTDSSQLVSTGSQSIVFWHWDVTNNQLSACRPRKGLSKLQSHVGNLVVSLHIPYRTEVISATNTGDIVLWNTVSNPSSSSSTLLKRDAVKSIRVTKKSAINVLEVIDQFIVVGANDGSIRFYDLQFRIVGWFDDINAGPISSISFATFTRDINDHKNHQQNHNEEMHDEFIVPEFIVATTTGQIVRLSSESMSKTPEIDSDCNEQTVHRGALIVQGFDASIVAMASHPNESVFITSSNNGQIQLIDYEAKTICAHRKFSGDMNVNSIAFEHSGRHICLGFNTGDIRLISSTSFADVHIFENDDDETQQQQVINSGYAIQHIAFSSDDKYLAVADDNFCVALYRFYYENEDKSKKITWIFIGRHRAHTSSIIDLRFMHKYSVSSSHNNIDESLQKLISTGRDKRLQQYDLGESCIKKGLLLYCTSLIEQYSIPTALFSMAMSDERSGQDTLIVANNDFKFRRHLFDQHSREQPKLVQTLRAPAYSDSSLHCVCKLPSSSYIVYASNSLTHKQLTNGENDKENILSSNYTGLIGLVKLPLDGLPKNATARIAHDDEVRCVCVSHDGRFVLSAGVRDQCVNMFAVRLDAFELTAQLQDEEKSMSHAAQGLDASSYAELQQYFHAAQLRHQGEGSRTTRVIGDTVSASETINILRSIGFYPTQWDIDNVCREIIFTQHSNKDEKSNLDEIRIDINTLVQLFVNHRRSSEFEHEEITNALRSVLRESSSDDDDETNVSAIANALSKHGEKMSAEELRECLQRLGICESNAKLHVKTFATDVLGLSELQSFDGDD